ncbi:hypothetical protein [Paenibacillus sp. MMO-58]|uniref:hypothetical protein n=1 Tax=Paenibacillus sp. MMO-58 TaxID=3081290 RepID=UPI0030169CFA
MNKYLPQMKKMYTIDPGAWGSLDWVLVIGGTFATLLCLGAFVYWIVKLSVRMLKISAGTARLNDPPFWKRMGISLMLILLFMAGAVFLIFEQIYKTMQNAGWHG